MKKLFILTLVIALCAVIFPHLFVRAQDQDLSRLDPAVRQEQDLAKVFKKHERLKLNAAQVADQVRSTKQLSIYTSSVAFDLELELNDMRGSNYRAVEADEDGVDRPVKMRPVRTYKGKVLGHDDAQARFTIDDETLEGLIITPEENYIVESMRKFSAAADATDFVLYRSSDVIEGHQGPIDHEVRRTFEGVAPRVKETLVPDSIDSVTAMREIEFSSEADAEYVAALGGSAAANDEIMTIMNMVEGVYQQQLDLTFKIVFQHTWTNAATDPYSLTEPGGCYNQTVCGPISQTEPKGILNEFMEYWNTHYPPGGGASNPGRDLAHMWTGKDVGGPNVYIVGLAWTDVVCRDPTYAYAFSQRVSSTPQEYIVTAHEIGHNFGACHPDQSYCASTTPTGCPNTIMVSSLSLNSVLQFCPFSVNQIKTYANANASCLSAAPSCTHTISPASKSFTSTGGSDRVNVTTGAGCSWAAQSNATWISITGGNSGTVSGTVSYTVAANTGTTSRTGTMTIAGKTFTITQAGASVTVPALSSLRLSASLVPGCKSVTGTVTLNVAAPVNGVVVTLSDNIAATNTPASVTVPSGAKTKTFTITTVPVTANQVGSVTAKLGAVTKSAPLTVRLIGVQAVSLNPNPVVGPNPVTGTVILECKANKNIAVALSSSNTSVAVPVSSVIVATGTSSKTFSVRTTNVSASSSAIIKATANGTSKTRTMTVN